MATGFSPLASGGPPPLSERRIVLLGKAGSGKNRVARVILRDTKLHEESEECVLYKRVQAGRRICIVDTPGWDSVSIECTTNKIKNEIERSTTLCPPGSHALILVLPVNTDDAPSLNELKSACEHMELLTKSVWNYTMVLFLCDEDVKESTVKEHIQKAEMLLEKCRGRHYVMRLSESEAQVHELWNEIEGIVEENLGNCLHVVRAVLQSATIYNKDTLNEITKIQGKGRSEVKGMVRQRRRSLEFPPPEMTEDSEHELERTASRWFTNRDQLPWNYNMPEMATMQFAGGGARYGIIEQFMVFLLIAFLYIILALLYGWEI